MAKKQVGAAPSGSTDAATKGYVDTAITTNIVALTQAAYDALGSGRPNVLYLITDA